MSFTRTQQYNSHLICQHVAYARLQFEDQVICIIGRNLWNVAYDEIPDSCFCVSTQLRYLGVEIFQHVHARFR